jgi:hypothetical protein
MKFVVHDHGSPVYQAESLVDAYVWINREFKRRWPRAIYGQQEAAAHGLHVVGTPELTPEEARELRAVMRRESR